MAKSFALLNSLEKELTIGQTLLINIRISIIRQKIWSHCRYPIYNVTSLKIQNPTFVGFALFYLKLNIPSPVIQMGAQEPL